MRSFKALYHEGGIIKYLRPKFYASVFLPVKSLKKSIKNVILYLYNNTCKYMTTVEILTLTNIILTAITLTVTYFNYRHSREKDFQDNLHKIKSESYKTIIDQCLDGWQQLDINSTPFEKIYDCKDKTEWDVYYEKNVSTLIHIGFDIQKTIFKETVFLPSKVMDTVFEFSNKCIRYVVIAGNFDTSLLIEKQDELHELFFEVINSLRSDLGIEMIDKSLKKRIKEMSNF